MAIPEHIDGFDGPPRWRRQGNRMSLCSEDLKQESVVPARHFPHTPERVLAFGLGDQVHCDVLDDRDVGGSMVSFRTRLSSSRKVTSSTRWRRFSIPKCERIAWDEVCRVFWQRGDEISRSPRRLSATFPNRDDTANAGQSLPLGMMLLQPVCCVALGIGSGFNPAFIAINILQ